MNKIREVIKVETEVPETYLGFTDKQNTKGKRFVRKAALATSLIAALASAGCVTNQDEPINTLPSATIEVPSTFTPKPTIEATPEETPTPTETLIPTPTYDPKGLNNPEDIFNEDITNYETQRLIDNYLQSTFFSSKNVSNWEDMNNIILWRGIPKGKISEENLDDAINTLFIIYAKESDNLSLAIDGKIRITSQNCNLFDLEPAFENGSPAETTYLKLFEMRRKLFVSIANGTSREIAQETMNLMYTDFVLSDNLLDGINDPYDKILILCQIMITDAAAMKIIDDTLDEYRVYDKNGNSVDVITYWEPFYTKCNSLYMTLISETVKARTELKSLTLN